jgi:hypothetical protein
MSQSLSINPEDGRVIFLHNIDIHLEDYTLSEHRAPQPEFD